MSQRIETTDLNVYYGSFLAVADVSMSIEPRTVTALIGPSGCGKSTFLRTVNRMHEVIAGARVTGTVTIDGWTCTPQVSTLWLCAARSGWSSSGPTRSRRCRSPRTSWPGCG